MAKKSVREYVCTQCGAVSASWSGKCHVCGEWNTFIEQEFATATKSSGSRKLNPQSVSSSISKDHKRLVSAIKDVDSVFGGGIIGGSVNLIAGQPGIGKSTLLMQLAAKYAQNINVLYVSGEESAHQVALRAERLGAKESNLQIVTAHSANDIASTITKSSYDLVIVDSIQMISVSELPSAAGTVSQITASTHVITSAAKQTNTAVILVGHVTKEGSIAGPKVLEHVVDVVLQLEGDRYGGLKVLRAVKNRYGPTSETAIFEMKNDGLAIVSNPSETLLAERKASDGSIVLATLEGSRPILVEIQALVNKTSYGYPKRAASGFDLNRLNLLVAMLEKRTKLQLAEHDIYINIIGGIKITEPAADLAICMAIGTATKGLQLNKDLVVFGEVGLLGEVRHVPFVDKRLEEAKKMGFAGAIGPRTKGLSASNKKLLHDTTDVRSALNSFLQK